MPYIRVISVLSTLVKMLARKGVILILVVIVIQHSFQQSSNQSLTKYEMVTVEANSFNDIRTTNFGGAVYV